MALRGGWRLGRGCIEWVISFLFSVCLFWLFGLLFWLAVLACCFGLLPGLEFWAGCLNTYFFHFCFSFSWVVCFGLAWLVWLFVSFWLCFACFALLSNRKTVSCLVLCVFGWPFVQHHFISVPRRGKREAQNLFASIWGGRLSFTGRQHQGGC